MLGHRKRADAGANEMKWAILVAGALFSLYHLNEAWGHVADVRTRIDARAVTAAFRDDPARARAVVAHHTVRCIWGERHASVHPVLRDLAVDVTAGTFAAKARGTEYAEDALEAAAVRYVRALARADEATGAAMQRDSATFEANAADGLRCAVERAARSFEANA